MTVLKFGAPWCSACKSLSHSLKTIDFKNTIIEEIDVEEFPEKAEEFQVMSLPTLILLKDGVVLETLIGSQSPSVIQEHIDMYL